MRKGPKCHLMLGQIPSWLFALFVSADSDPVSHLAKSKSIHTKMEGADTPAAVYDLVKQRWDECFSCQSPGYMASHLYFVKQWIWFCLEVAEVNPMRKWTGSCDDFEDGLIEAFVLTCSCRFITWGSINQARMHVVEFLRWTTGVVPPEMPKTTYTMQNASGLSAVAAGPGCADSPASTLRDRTVCHRVVGGSSGSGFACPAPGCKRCSMCSEKCNAATCSRYGFGPSSLSSGCRA
jgi:hypothetical protein